MSAKAKLNEARRIFHSKEIKKTGYNKFSNYPYFELSDFLVPALQIFYDLKLSGIVSFATDIATMEITDLEDETSVHKITSPMSTAALKACHEVQNLGAVETYIRRYLWVAALEIVEHDAIDSSPGAEPKQKPAKLAHTKGNERPATTAARVAAEIIEAIRADLTLRVVEKYQAACDESEEFADQVWARFGPEERDYITAALNEANKQAA